MRGRAVSLVRSPTRSPQTPQTLTEIKFLLRMRGALTEAPRMLLPVMKMPHAAPITHRKSALDVPTAASEKGLRGRAGGRADERASGAD